jgi:hypothetical protein
MSRYERFALVLDPTGGHLGVEALGLIERGIDPVYAKSVDEALLLAQDDERVGALVMPGTLPLETLDETLTRVTPQLWAGAAAVLIVAPPRERALMRALRDRGIRWILHAPYDAAELRFAVAAALATEDDLDPRNGLRVPIRLAATVAAGAEAPREAWLRNVSVGGAYLALPEPPAVGETVAVQVSFGDRGLAAVGRVAHRLAAPLPGRAEREPGIGVAFQPLDDAGERLLEEFIRERVNSFRL